MRLNLGHYAEQEWQGAQKSKRVKRNEEGESTKVVHNELDEYDIFGDNELAKELENASEQVEIRRKKKQKKKAQEKVPDLFSYQRMWNVKKDLAANQNTHYRKGRFTEEEVERLAEEISDYAARNHLSEEELNLLCRSTTKSVIPKAWVQIAQVLPDRSVLSVHNLVHRRFNPENYLGAWTPDDEQKLLLYVNQLGRKWNAIAEKLHRTARNVRDKYKSLGENNYKTRAAVQEWKVGCIVQLLELIQKYQSKQQQNCSFLSSDYKKKVQEIFGAQWETQKLKSSQFMQTMKKRRQQVVDDDEMRQFAKFSQIVNHSRFNTLNESNIPWTKIAGKVKVKSKDDLRNFWYFQLVPWLRSSAVVNQPTIDELIIDIYRQNAEDESEIDFNQVLVGQDYSTKEKKEQWSILKKFVAGRKEIDYREIIKILYERTKKQRGWKQSDAKGEGNAGSQANNEKEPDETNDYLRLVAKFREKCKSYEVNMDDIENE